MANGNWRAYEDDPRFKALDYDKQLRIKQLFAQKYLVNEPVFQQLSPAGQQELFKRYVTKPSLETDLNTPVGQHLTNLIDIARQVKSNNDNELIRRIQSWFFDARLTGVQSVPAKLISDALNSLGLPQQTSKITGEKIVNLQDLYRDPATMRDIKKIHKYNDILIQDVPGMKMANTLREFTFTMLEAGIYNKILVGAGSSVAGAVLRGDKAVKGGLLTNKIFQKIAQGFALDKQHGKVIQFLGTKVLPLAVEESAEGLIWATRGLVEDLVDGKDLTVENALKNYAQDFGFGMGMQALLGAGSVLKSSLGRTGRKILGVTDDPALITKNLSAEEGKYLMLEGISPDSMPPTVKKSLIARGYGDTIKAMEDYAQKVKINHTIDTGDPEQVITQVMKTGGIDLKRIGDKFELTSFSAEPFKVTVDSLEDAMIQYERFINKITGQVSPESFVARGVATDSLKARRALDVTLPNDTKVSGKAFINNLNPETGRLVNDNVLISVRKFLKQNNVPQEVIDKLSVKQYDDYFSGQRYSLPLGDELPLPSYLKTAADQEHYLSGLKRYLDRGLRLGNVELPAKTLDDLFKTLKLPRGSRLLTDDTWIARQVAGMQGSLKQLPDGAFQIRHADGSLETFANKEELGQSLYNNAISESDVKNFLENEIGYGLKQDNQGRWAVQAEGRTIGPYEDIQELLRDNPNFRPPYPMESGPRISLIDENLNKVRIINDRVIQGPADLIERHLRNHADWSKQRKFLTKTQLPDLGNKRVSIDKQRKTYWLEDPVTGFKKSFRSLRGKGGMETFLSNTKSRYDDLTQQAVYGGYKITADKGGFYMVGKDKSFFARNLEELEELISKEAKQLDAPEMTADLFPEEDMLRIKRSLTETVDLPPEGHKKLSEAAIDKQNSIGFTEKFKDFTAPMRGAFGVLEGTINKFPAAKIFLKPAQALKISLFNHQRHMNNIRDQLTARIKNAKLNKSQKRIMTEILMQEVPRDQWVNVARNMDVPVNDNMITEMNFIRDTFDQLQDTFNIPKSMRIENYFTRLKRIFQNEIESEGFIGDAAEVIRKAVSQGQLPAGVDEYFRNARTSDVLSFVLEKDPYSVLMKYIDVGFRKINVTPFWESLNNTLQNYKKTSGEVGIVPKRVLDTTQHMLDVSRGQHNSQALKDIKEVTLSGTIKLSKHLKKVEDKILEMFPDRHFDEKASIRTKLRDRLEGVHENVIGEDPFAPIGRGIIGATQAFKPWLVVRNLHQPLMTVAPYFGFDYTMAGYRTVTNPKQFRNIREYMRSNGFLNTIAPREIPVVRGKNSMLQKINDKGLAAYKWSDDVTRMVAFATVDHKFTDALTAMRKNPGLDRRWFIKHSGLFSVDPVTQDAVFDTLTRGDVAGARDIFAQQVISNGLFDYMGIANPKMFTGLKGKIFGTFGTYPVQYTENIYRALRSGDMEDRVLFITRLLGASAALTAFYSEMFDADVQSFNPLSTMFFTGSPIYQQAIDTLEITGGLGSLAQTGELGYRAKQALGRTKQRLPQAFIPYIGRGMDFVSAGADSKHGDGWFPSPLKKILATPGRNQ